ncbi:hypothetical protein MXB_218 [Myxobolus squamalis]|nr:hypothetical protein MXB_218 [Myxobolus squamalis]
MDDKCDVLSENLINFGLSIVSLVISISLIMNLLLPIVIFTDLRLRKRANIYLASFSLSLYFFTFWLIPDMVAFKSGSWIMGNEFCKISAFFMEFSMVLSTLFLLWVCLDRYLMIFKPGKYQAILNNQLLNIILSIILAALLCIPFPIIYTSIELSCNISEVNSSTKLNTCYYHHSNADLTIAAFMTETVLVFVVPLVIMVVLYSKILHYVHKSSQPNVPKSPKPLLKSEIPTAKSVSTDLATRPLSRCENSVKIAKQSKLVFSRGLITTLVIIVFYVVTWTPLMIVRTLTLLNVNLQSVVVRSVQFVFILYLCFYPTIYIVTNDKIRNSLVRKIKLLFRY